ncbi:MAG TPA: hypothetical protein VF257_16580 [Solirubrobacteraceae bacterium]
MALLVLAFMGATASQAWATLEIQSYNDPAGDDTVMSYRLLKGDGNPAGGGVPDPFNLLPTERRSFGPPPGTYAWKALPPAGWKVAAIACQRVDPTTGVAQPSRPGEFTIDVANGQVNIDHRQDEDQYCAFTNQRISGSGTSSGGGSGQGASSGVSPTLPGGAPGSLAPALLKVTPGLRFAKATIRITRKSLIKAQLLKGNRVVGSLRVTHRAGTHVVKVSLTRKARRSFQRQGLKRVTLTLRIVVVGSNRATKVLRFGVVVRL